MAELRDLPTIYQACAELEFPIPFGFYTARDVRITAIDKCGVERVLEQSEYSIKGGGDNKPDCKPRDGKLCLNRAMPDHSIVVEHFPNCIVIDPSAKPLTRKEAARLFERMYARSNALEHRLTLAARVPLHHPGAGTLMETTDDGPMCDDGLWDDCNSVLDDGVWHITILAAKITDDGKWDECSPVDDDGVWPSVAGFADDGMLDDADCDADDGKWCASSPVSDDGFWEDGSYDYLACLTGVPVKDDGKPDLSPPKYCHKKTTKIETDGDVSRFYGSRALRMEVHNGQLERHCC